MPVALTSLRRKTRYLIAVSLPTSCFAIQAWPVRCARINFALIVREVQTEICTLYLLFFDLAHEVHLVEPRRRNASGLCGVAEAIAIDSPDVCDALKLERLCSSEGITSVVLSCIGASPVTNAMTQKVWNKGGERTLI